MQSTCPQCTTTVAIKVTGQYSRNSYFGGPGFDSHPPRWSLSWFQLRYPAAKRSGSGLRQAKDVSICIPLNSPFTVCHKPRKSAKCRKYMAPKKEEISLRINEHLKFWKEAVETCSKATCKHSPRQIDWGNVTARTGALSLHLTNGSLETDTWNERVKLMVKLKAVLVLKLINVRAFTVGKKQQHPLVAGCWNSQTLWCRRWREEFKRRHDRQSAASHGHLLGYYGSKVLRANTKKCI
jgi:hypothetical protein